MGTDKEIKTETPDDGPKYPGVTPRPQPERKPEPPKPADKPRK